MAAVAAMPIRGDRGDRAHAVEAEGGERFQIRLDAGSRARVAARNCQRRTHTLRSAVMYPTFFDAMTARPDARFRAAEQAGAVLFVTVLTAIAAQISVPLPFTPVPFTFQPMVVLVGAAALGSRLGLASQILYLALGIAGLPVFAASPLLPQGMARLAGPTGGYLMAYPFAAYAAGWLAERGFDRRYLTAVVAMVAGLVVVFAGGVAWLAVGVPQPHGVSAALASGLYPFLLPDLAKLCVAAAVMPALWRLTANVR
jgi:biotin transport system substrate-specific component